VVNELRLPGWCKRGRDSAVGIATRYGLSGPGIDSRWGREFPHPSRSDLGPTQPPIQWISGFFPGGKASGAWRWPPTRSSAEVKNRVGLYLYSPSGPSWPVIGWPLPLHFIIIIYHYTCVWELDGIALLSKSGSSLGQCKHCCDTCLCLCLAPIVKCRRRCLKYTTPWSEEWPHYPSKRTLSTLKDITLFNFIMSQFCRKVWHV
jgi:hypothetical protein